MEAFQGLHKTFWSILKKCENKIYVSFPFSSRIRAVRVHEVSFNEAGLRSLSMQLNRLKSLLYWNIAIILVNYIYDQLFPIGVFMVAP